MCEWEVSNAIPAVGQEFDAGKKMAALIPVDIYTLGPGGTTHRGSGFIISDTFSHAVDSASKYSFRVRGPLSLFS